MLNIMKRNISSFTHRVLLLVLLSIILQHTVRAQQLAEREIDSLIQIARQVQGKDQYSMAIVANRAYKLAYQSPYKAGWANAARLKGIVHQFGGEYDKALVLHNEAVNLFKEIGDTLQTARTYYNIAALHDLRSDYERTIEYGLKAIKIFDQLEDLNGQGRVYNLMGIAANVRGDYASSITYFKRHLQKVTSVKDTLEMATGYNNIGATFQSMGKIDSAIYYLHLAEQLYTNMGGHRNMSSIYQNLGTLYEELKMFDKAINCYRKSIELAKDAGNRKNEAGSYNNLGKIMNLQGRWNEAVSYLSEARSIASETGDFEVLYKSNEQLARAKAAQGQYEEAYRFQVESALYGDSLYVAEKMKSAHELETKYETEKKEQRIEILTQETDIQRLKLRQRTFLWIATAVLLCFVTAAVYLWQNQQKIQAEIRLQRQAAQDILEAEERERRRIAADLHDGVGQMLSAALLNLNDLHDKIPTDTSGKLTAEKTLALINESYNEMRSISHQMMPNALLKAGLASSVREFVEKLDGPKMKVYLDVVGLDERLDEQSETVIYRIIQEAVANVVKHAKASKLDIQLIKDKDGIDLVIEDNGVGFKSEKIHDFDGIGLRNIRSRVALLGGMVDIDTSPGQGTLLAIHIPLKN